ncbi:IS3 family transposase [Emcibacter sp.]|uniref:IS3 family transposase n=1 Tax=Emcibacter sp. TaxID=1979954 RepID=UPI002AA915BC|nr:IS3 family transposase [Emcibacter sp.]
MWLLSGNDPGREEQSIDLSDYTFDIGPEPGLIHPSDYGGQYVATEYQMTLKKYAIVPSMPGKGNCYVCEADGAQRRHNAAVEAFSKTLKAELAWRVKFEYREQAERIINEYIVNFYNRKWRHSTFGTISPMAYEK